MSSVPLNVARVSMQMQGSLLLGTLQTSQLNLLKVQQQLSTGQRLNRASEDPGATQPTRWNTHGASRAPPMKTAHKYTKSENAGRKLAPDGRPVSQIGVVLSSLPRGCSQTSPITERGGLYPPAVRPKSKIPPPPVKTEWRG